VLLHFVLPFWDGEPGSIGNAPSSQDFLLETNPEFGTIPAPVSRRVPRWDERTKGPNSVPLFSGDTPPQTLDSRCCFSSVMPPHRTLGPDPSKPILSATGLLRPARRSQFRCQFRNRGRAGRSHRWGWNGSGRSGGEWTDGTGAGLHRGCEAMAFQAAQRKRTFGGDADNSYLELQAANVKQTAGSDHLLG
jgi:hypothetical protein